MEQALEQKLQQFRGRLQSGPAGKFASWWLGELKQAMPSAWQQKLQHAMRRVTLSLDGESRVLVPGEQANFGAAKMTVKLLSSLAVEGESANAIEGDPYRVELFGWRTP